MNRTNLALESNKVEVTVIDRREKQILKQTFDKSDLVSTLKKEIADKCGIRPERQYLTIPKSAAENAVGERIVLKESYQTLGHYELSDSVVVTLKDLGPQVSWTTVFVVEYIGPILIFSIVYIVARATGRQLSLIQNLGTLLVILHFVKREFETCFVHIFGNDTMPIKRIFINSLHYWVLCGVLISLELLYLWKDPGYPNVVVGILVGLWALFEFLNFMCHLTLRWLRTRSGYAQLNEDSSNPEAVRRRRGIPHGWGFGFVSCANYWWETLAWITFSILVSCWTAYLFTLVSFIQMASWALKKHRQYQKEFNGEDGREKYPRGRTAIVPFVL